MILQYGLELVVVLSVYSDEIISYCQFIACVSCSMSRLVVLCGLCLWGGELTRGREVLRVCDDGCGNAADYILRCYKQRKIICAETDTNEFFYDIIHSARETSQKLNKRFLRR